MKFTKEQIQAIQHGQGPGLIIAVPGAGKTSVLMQRISHLVEKKQVRPEKIVSITFSKMQALDMAHRTPYKQAVFSTIHAYCYRIIRFYLKKTKENLRLIESSNFSKQAALKRIYYQLTGKYLKEEEVEDFFLHYSYYKNRLEIPPKDHQPLPHFIPLWRAYEDYKKVHYYFDFDDMQTLALELIEDPDFLQTIQGSFDYLQVDEAQDNSPLQLAIIKKLVQPKNNVLFVADDDQSIYSFRGASADYLLNFKDHFSNSKLYFLEENHRSSPEIIRASNKIISNNQARYEKNIYTHQETQQPIQLIKTKNKREQYQELIKNIEKVPPDRTLAVLYRSNISALALCQLLKKHEIRFFIPRYKLEFLDSFILEDLIDLIAFSEEPNNLSVFSRIFYKLNAYIKKTSLRILETYPEKMPVLDRLLDDSTLSDFYTDKFLDLKESFAHIKKVSMTKKISYIFTHLGYHEYLKERMKLDKKSTSLDVLIELYQLIFEHCESARDMALEVQELKDFIIRSSRTPSSLTLSTVHGSKGLEYDEVHVIDLSQDEFPLKNTDDNIEDQVFLEEERRLFYVAMTRAKSDLSLYTYQYLNQKKVKPSIFLEELKK